MVPLGEYELRLRLSGARGQLDLTTLSGPLRLQGSGTIGAAGLDFSGTASADQPWRPGLAGLLAVLGERSGDGALLRLKM